MFLLKEARSWALFLVGPTSLSFEGTTPYLLVGDTFSFVALLCWRGGSGGGFYRVLFLLYIFISLSTFQFCLIFCIQWCWEGKGGGSW